MTNKTEKTETTEERQKRLEPGHHKESATETKEVRVSVGSPAKGATVRDLLRSFDAASSPAGQSAEGARIETTKDGFDLVWDVPVTPDEKAYLESQKKAK